MAHKDHHTAASGRPSDSEAIVRTMAAGVAHEFNNLLGAVLACAEEALESTNELQLRRNLRTIISRVDQACVITANLLSFACQEYITRRPVDLAALLDDALTVMEPRISAASVVLVRDYHELPPIPLDASRMERVFLNLIANAVEAMTAPGGRLTVSLSSDAGHAIVRVSDTGTGIPLEILDRVFEPFVTTKGVFAGGDTSALGLGLSVCQGIVRMHGGAITIDSSPQGTIVTVSLPLNPPSDERGGDHES